MARRNLKYQFLQAINNSFRESMDNHSDKANGTVSEIPIRYIPIHQELT